jgi:hypothetical protein
MIANFVETVNKKIEDEKLLVIGIDWTGGHETNAVIPDKIITDDHGICIESKNLILNITNEEKYDMFYDEEEEEFIINQGHVTYHFS